MHGEPPCSQFLRVIFRPSGRNHHESGSLVPSPTPARNVARRNTGCSRRSSISRLVKSSSRSFVSSMSQCTHEISLSWQ